MLLTWCQKWRLSPVTSAPEPTEDSFGFTLIQEFLGRWSGWSLNLVTSNLNLWLAVNDVMATSLCMLSVVEWQHIILFGSVCAWGASRVCVFVLVLWKWKCACVGINNWVILLRARYKCSRLTCSHYDSFHTNATVRFVSRWVACRWQTF